MNDDKGFPLVALLIPIGLFYLVYAVKGIAKGEIKPYQHGVEKKWQQKEKPILFWICAIGSLLMGILLIAYAIFSLLAR